ncbi:hypothetical protein OS493_036220 [Desmophyllum pertusum]|uniref:EGF-like domain-containing protein n=1 Tax=Desmophyllum pertusum TaxID=174260 RepID=A0A9W9Y7F3_9CNID|nr:hypothetical protein OS493_036220 [Desmophyllum pertusum]
MKVICQHARECHAGAMEYASHMRTNVHDYTCNCTEGYEGRNCDIHTACQSENCNGGECIAKDSNPEDFICLCPLKRVGVQLPNSHQHYCPIVHYRGRYPIIPGIPRAKRMR